MVQALRWATQSRSNRTDKSRLPVLLKIGRNVDSQVGAVVGSFGTSSSCSCLVPDEGFHVQCASLKANMGHLEASAAAAGLASLLLTPLLSGAVAVNA
jgi:hypothetical protein